MNGTLLIDKPQGMTSHDVVAKARKALGTRAIGHAGTLDPMATGLLILLIGNATRLSEYVLHLDKAYSATLKFGEQTNTDDAEGEVIATRPVPALTLDLLRSLSRPFIGEIEQVPPQFSAISKNGVRAYALARKGEQVEMDARKVNISEIEFTHLEPPFAKLNMTCGSGTYVRSLARDFGQLLGCGAHLTALRRTRIGPLPVDSAVLPTTIAPQHVQPLDAAIQHLPAVRMMDATNTEHFFNGREARYEAEPITPGSICRVYDSTSTLIGIATTKTDQCVQPSKVFKPES